MKRLILLPVLMLIFSMNTANASFTDVSSENEFFTYINWLQNQGVVQGYSDGSFGVYNDINRAEFLKMLYKTTGFIDSKNFPKESPFSDISNDAWYYKYVMQAYTDGIVQGYGDGTFKPGNDITLAEALKIVEEAFFSSNMGDMIGEGCSSVEVFQGCGPAVPNTDGRMGCTKLTNTDWSFTYFCVDKWINIHGPGLLVQADTPISRGIMAQMLYRAKAVHDNNFLKYSSEIFPNDLSLKSDDPNEN